MQEPREDTVSKYDCADFMRTCGPAGVSGTCPHIGHALIRPFDGVKRWTYAGQMLRHKSDGMPSILLDWSAWTNPTFCAWGQP